MVKFPQSQGPRRKPMKGFRFFALLFLTLFAASAGAQTISASDAKSHLGERATVCGKVADERTSASSRGTPTFINLDAAYPKQIFTILIWGENRTKVGELPRVGSGICVSGTIQDYRGVPEIVVKSSGQLAQKPVSSNEPSGDRYYTNSDGQRVHSPVQVPSAPAGATAQCRDGSYSFSQHRQGTCSHHGGVARWL